MVGDFEQVNLGKSAPHELGIDPLLDVAREQDAVTVELAEQHDRHVVDRRAAICRLVGHTVWVGPEHAELDVVKAEPIAGCEAASGWWHAVGKCRRPRLVAGTRTAHPGLVDPPDAISREDRGQARNVVLVRVRQHKDVDTVIPRWQALVQGEQEAPRIGSAVDYQPSAAPALDQDAIALPHVEYGDVDKPVGSMD
jgi:hypothetical protein